MDKEAIWTLIQENLQALNPFYLEAMGKAIQDSGVPDHWFGLSLARGCEPEPLSFNRIQELYPYADSERLDTMLESLVKAQMLERVSIDAYMLTDVGRETVEGIYTAAHKELKTVEPLPKNKMADLNDLLLQLVEAIVVAKEPEDKWSFCYSRWTDPGRGLTGVVRTDQYLTDLYRFRDDAHVASWKKHGTCGGAWEVLTVLWREGAKTCGELVETLSFRGRDEVWYEQNLVDLIARGWVEEEVGKYRATEKGSTIRQRAEEETNRIYFAPWEILNEGQIGELRGLLESLNESLIQISNGQEG